ncbi:Rv0361 family membrane protein [Mycobacterium paraterrae]|uniref:DUF8174 domain-containing protein n=1 Tax=Mycobacterium paraterrae TaxID=577492 RepID=A0ABY3VVT4_9MYCO|nr:hypothetical protein [Mycobacterium paraterrae]UMB71605.1 hypothetical protein MKK62_10395 [Mycobacterium paraterrae]
MPGPSSSDHQPGSQGPPLGYPAPPYTGPVPPAAPFQPPRRGRRRLVGVGVALLVVAAVATGLLYLTHRSPARGAGAFSDATAKSAIQGYLNALQNRDTEAVARNTLCGIYDGVRDRRSDQALAKLSSDAFRKQFSEAQVTSIDKIVYWSDYQAQVLFTMRVQPSTGSSARTELQGVAQLISQHNQILVCSYVLHGAGVY